MYYSTRGFITSNHVFNLLTCAFNLPTRAFILATRAFSLLIRGFELVTGGFKLVTRGFELITCISELVTGVLLFYGGEVVSFELRYLLYRNNSEQRDDELISTVFR